MKSRMWICGLAVLACVPLVYGEDVDSKVRLLEAENRALRSQVAALNAEVKRLAAARTPPAGEPASQPAPTVVSHPEWIPSFKHADQGRARDLASVAAEIKREEQLLKQFPRGEFRRQTLAELRERHKALSGRGAPPLMPLDEPRMEVGQAGTLLDGWFRVQQVLDANQAVGEIRGPDKARPGTHERGFLTRVPTVPTWRRVLLVGIDTTGMADGQTVHRPGAFIVTGTRRMQTAVGGSITDFVVEPLDEKAWQAAYLAWKKLPTPPTPR